MSVYERKVSVGLGAFFLAMVLCAVVMMVTGCGDKVGVAGDYKVAAVNLMGRNVEPTVADEDLEGKYSVTLTLKEDGTGRFTMDGKAVDIVWQLNESELSVKDGDGKRIEYYVGGTGGSILYKDGRIWCNIGKDGYNIESLVLAKDGDDLSDLGVLSYDDAMKEFFGSYPSEIASQEPAQQDEEDPENTEESKSDIEEGDIDSIEYDPAMSSKPGFPMVVFWDEDKNSENEVKLTCSQGKFIKWDQETGEIHEYGKTHAYSSDEDLYWSPLKDQSLNDNTTITATGREGDVEKECGKIEIFTTDSGTYKAKMIK